MTERIRCLIYVRVSTEEQAEKGYSLEAQEDECRKRAYAVGYPGEQLLVLRDDVSGTVLDRPGLNELRERVRGAERPDIVILLDPDRLARKLTLQLLVTEELVKQGVRLEFVHFDWQDTPEGRMFYQLRGMFAEFEREKIRERTMRGRWTKLEKHGKLSGDPRLFGYRFETDRDELVVDPAESGIVRFMFERCAAGGSGERIAKELAERGIPAPRGTRWYGSTVTRILRNRTYLGTFMAYKVDYALGYRRKRPLERQVAITVDALVSAALFDRAQLVLDRNRTRVGRRGDRPYMLSGLGRCFCGRSVVGGATRGTGYYRCVGKHKSGFDVVTGKPLPKCGSDYWNSEITDAVVWRYVCEAIVAAGETLDTMAAYAGDDAGTAERNMLGARLETLHRQSQRLVDLYIAGRIGEDEYDRRRLAADRQKAQLSTRLAQTAAAAEHAVRIDRAGSGAMGEAEAQPKLAGGIGSQGSSGDPVDRSDSVTECTGRICTEGSTGTSLNPAGSSAAPTGCWRRLLEQADVTLRRKIVELAVREVTFAAGRSLTIALTFGRRYGKPCDGESDGGL